MRYWKIFYLSIAVTLIFIFVLPVIASAAEYSSKFENEYRITPIEINLDTFQSGKKVQIGPYDIMAGDICTVNMGWDGGGEITVVCKPTNKNDLEKVVQVKSDIPSEIVVNSDGEYSFTVINSTSSILTNFDGTVNCIGKPIQSEIRTELQINSMIKNMENSSNKKVIKEIEIPLDGIDTISVEMNTEHVTILPSKEESVKVINYGNPSITFLDEEKVQMELMGDNVTISSGKWKIDWKEDRIQNVEIYIPLKYNNILKLSIVGGSMSSKIPFLLKSFESKLGSGMMDFGKIVANDYQIDVGSGEMGIGILGGSGKIIVSSGNMSVNNINILDTLGLECYSGNIECNVAKNTSIDFKGSYRTGNLITYFNQTEKEENKTIAMVGSSPYKKLTANTNSGSIKIAESK